MSTQYIAIRLPGHYVAGEAVSPVATFADRDEAERYVHLRPRLGVIEIDPDTQSAPWLAHDLDTMHRDEADRARREAEERARQEAILDEERTDDMIEREAARHGWRGTNDYR